MAERCAITQNKNWKIKFKIYWLSETELTLCNCVFLKSPTVLNLIQRKKFAVINFNFCFIFTDQAITFFVSELFKSYCCGKYQGNLCHTTCCLWRGTITQHLYLWYPGYSPLIHHLNWTHTKIFITIAEKKNSTSIERSNWQLQLPTPPHKLQRYVWSGPTAAQAGHLNSTVTPTVIQHSYPQHVPSRAGHYLQDMRAGRNCKKPLKKI